MVDPYLPILTVKFTTLYSKQEIILDRVQQGLRVIAGSALLAHDDHCIFSVLEGEHLAVLLEVPNSLVVDIEILRICQVGLIVLEVVEPGLEVGKYLPATLPHPPTHPPRVVLVQQHQIELVRLFLVLREAPPLFKLQSLVQFSFERVSLVVLLISPICKRVGALLIKFLDEVLKIEDLQAALELL